MNRCGHHWSQGNGVGNHFNRGGRYNYRRFSDGSRSAPRNYGYDRQIDHGSFRNSNSFNQRYGAPRRYSTPAQSTVLSKCLLPLNGVPAKRTSHNDGFCGSPAPSTSTAIMNPNVDPSGRCDSALSLFWPETHSSGMSPAAGGAPKYYVNPEEKFEFEGVPHIVPVLGFRCLACDIVSLTADDMKKHLRTSYHAGSEKRGNKKNETRPLECSSDELDYSE